MRFLWKILQALGIIILMAVIKVFILKFSPDSQIFSYNLLTCLQMMLLLWAVVTGLLETTLWRELPVAKARRKGFVAIIFILSLAESSAYLMIHHPRYIPHPLLIASKYYYDNYERNILQYDRNISRYDSTLFYCMKSNNRSVFANIEFSDSICTGQSGWRMDRHNTTPPTVLCLGDSYTLGWGVRQQESFPAVLQQQLRTPVLNTGMSSYGTAREIASINCIDKSALQTVIIQYCNNDAGENEACVKNNLKPVISPRQSYDSAVDFLGWSKAWFPGKYSLTLFKLVLAERLESFRSRPSALSATQPLLPSGYDQEAQWFLNILKTSGFDFTRTRVFVFDICEYRQLTGNFLYALERKLADSCNEAVFKDHVHTVHVESILTPNDYYILDEHIKASGHAKIARKLAEVILKQFPKTSASPRNTPTALTGRVLENSALRQATTAQRSTMTQRRHPGS